MAVAASLSYHFNNSAIPKNQSHSGISSDSVRCMGDFCRISESYNMDSQQIKNITLNFVFFILIFTKSGIIIQGIKKLRR